MLGPDLRLDSDRRGVWLSQVGVDQAGQSMAL